MRAGRGADHDPRGDHPRHIGQLVAEPDPRGLRLRESRAASNCKLLAREAIATDRRARPVTSRSRPRVLAADVAEVQVDLGGRIRRKPAPCGADWLLRLTCRYRVPRRSGDGSVDAVLILSGAPAQDAK
jgi:hypothetical protein